MKKTKRLAAALLTIMAVSTACVAPPKEEAPAAPAAGTTQGADSGTSQSQETGSPEELTIWAWDQNFNIAAMNTAAEYYRKAGHPDFNLNIIEVEENAVETKSITAFTSGVSEGMPDILLMGDYSAQSFLNNYKGKYADLTDAIDFSQFAQ